MKKRFFSLFILLFFFIKQDLRSWRAVVLPPPQRNYGATGSTASVL